MTYEPIPERDEELAHALIGAAIEVHRYLGPGFVESIYEHALCHELATRGVPFCYQVEIRVPYKGILLPAQRYDLLVGDRVLAELKAVSELAPIHEAQLFSYLRSLRLRLGLLINFNVKLLKDGIKRIVL